jgi:hypothetical protein
VWTAGALSIIIDAEHKGGLNRELRERLEARGSATYCAEWPLWPVYAIEAMKTVLDEMVAETGIEVQLYTHVVAVAREGKEIKGVFTESKSGREFIEAKVVIDTTGDGDVAAQAGCAFEFGRPADGKAQPMTLYGRIGGYRGDKAAHVEPMLSIAKANGLNPSYERITLFPQPGQPGVFMLMATHLYGSAIDVRNLTKAELEGRRQIRDLVALLKAKGGDEWKDIYLIDTGPFLGVREGRRIRGRYYITVDDIQEGRRFDDGICNVPFVADIHEPDPSQGNGIYHVRVKPYDIPYRALVARDVDNLLMAGRCISGDHYAHASYRVTGDAVATGEAAGMAAAMAVEQRVPPPEIDSRMLLARLLDYRGPVAPPPPPRANDDDSWFLKKTSAHA